MKYIFQYKYALLLSVLLVGSTACEDITELNVDPNNPIDVPAGAVAITQSGPCFVCSTGLRMSTLKSLVIP